MLRLSASLMVLVAWATAGTACYDPRIGNCQVTCAQPTDCAGGQVCGASGFCQAPDFAGSCDLDGSDASVTGSDADVIDEPDASPGACPGGPVMRLHAGRPGPTFVVADEAWVYWLERGTADADFADGGLFRIAKDGGDAIPLAENQDDARFLVLDDTRVYYFRQSDRMLVSVPKSGGNALEYGPVQGNLRGLAVDDAFVYAAINLNGGNGAVYKLDKATRDVSPVAMSLPLLVTMTDDATSIYVATDTELYRVPKSGDDPVSLATVENPRWMIAGADHVYLTQQAAAGPDTGSVVRVPKAGGTAQVVAAQQSPLAPTVDDANVYWTSDDGSIRQRRLDGSGEIRLLADGENSARGIASDGCFVYWVNDARLVGGRQVGEVARRARL